MKVCGNRECEFFRIGENNRCIYQTEVSTCENYRAQTPDPVAHPKHYTAHPSGVECIQITEHENFCIGNAIKYLWRAGQKDESKTIEDLRKAVWYIEREIKRIEGTK